MECRNLQRGGWSGKAFVEICFVKLKFSETLNTLHQNWVLLLHVLVCFKMLLRLSIIGHIFFRSNIGPVHKLCLFFTHDHNFSRQWLTLSLERSVTSYMPVSKTCTYQMEDAGYAGQNEYTASWSRGQKPFLGVTLSVTATGTAFRCCNSQNFLPS